MSETGRPTSWYQIGLVVAAVKWLILTIMGFALPFILGGEWGMLNGLEVLIIVPWAFAQAGLGMTMLLRTLFRLADCLVTLS